MEQKKIRNNITGVKVNAPSLVYFTELTPALLVKDIAKNPSPSRAKSNLLSVTLNGPCA